MAKEKIKKENLNELAAWIAQGPDFFAVFDFFGKGKDMYEDLTHKNPLIRKYELHGRNFLFPLIRGDDISEADKKLLIEASVFGRPSDVKSANLWRQLPEDKLQKYKDDIEEKKLKMDATEHASYIADQRRILFKDRLPETIKGVVYKNVAPTLPIRGHVYLDLETEEYVNSDTGKRSKNSKDVEHSESFSDYILRELNVQSGAGFNPEVPEYLGEQTGYKDVPLDIKRHYDITTKGGEGEGFKETTRTVDRLNDYRKISGLEDYLQGPEGRYYNQETGKFVTRQPTYGSTPELQGYQYDPRLKGILSQVYGPSYAEGFNKGGVMEGRSPYQNKGEVEIEEKVEVKEEDSGNINLLDQLRRWWNLQRHFENMPEEEVDYSKVEVEESEETKGDREKDKEIIEYLEKVRTNMNRGGLSGQAQDVANAGRYGDTMLMHVNPAEVQGLKSLGMPITTNPQTGQPEAFLPLIGALLGSMGVFGGVAPWLTGAMGSGILSGVGSLLQGDSAKEAILTGLGSAAMGKLGGALGKGSPDALKAGAQGGAEGLTTTLTDAGVDIGTEGIADILANPVGKIGDLSKLTQLDKGILQNALDVGTKSGIEEFAGKGLGAYSKEGTRIGPTWADAKEGFSFGNLYEGATSPDVFLPAAIGGGGLGAIKSQEDFERLMAEYQEDRKRRRAKAFADNPEQVPYGSQWGRILGVPPRPVSSGGRMGFFGGGLGSLGQIPQPLGGYTTPYADRPAINMPPYNENLVMGRG